ncbi:MAG: pentapeptide repeat-containing protein [Cyanobacteria bacterium P01_F01_bin.150]
MNVAEFLDLYKTGKRNFKWIDLRHADLRGAELVGADFSRANLSHAQFEQANLFTANLYKANLSHANFTGANLKKANVRGAQLEGIVWEQAQLDGAQFSPSDIEHLPEAVRPDELRIPVVESTATPLSTPVPDNPEATLPRSQIPASVTLSRPQTLATPAYTRLTLQHWTKLPRPPLALLILGYVCLGILLGLYQTGVGAGLLVWSSALIVAWDEALVWFLPVCGAIATLVSIGLSLWALLFAGLVLLTLIVSLKFLGWSWRKALSDSLWVAGIATLFISSANWLFAGYGRTVIVSGRFPMAILLFLGIGGLGLGAIGWVEMKTLGYTQRARSQVFAISAAVGLLIGLCMGHILVS